MPLVVQILLHYRLQYQNCYSGSFAANAADLVLCPGDNIAFDIASTNSGTLDASSSAGYNSYLSVATAKC